MQARSVVLVEGASDRVALTTLARLQGRDLTASGVLVVAMDGVTNIRAFATRYGPGGLGLPLSGLYDAPAARVVGRGLAATGVIAADGRDADVDLAAAGFSACHDDLEDELVRALGEAAVEEVIDAAGESRSLRLLSRMPAQRGWTRAMVLRRFLTSQSGRKARYAGLLVEAIGPAGAPPPLLDVLERAEANSRSGWS